MCQCLCAKELRCNSHLRHWDSLFRFQVDTRDKDLLTRGGVKGFKAIFTAIQNFTTDEIIFKASNSSSFFPTNKSNAGMPGRNTNGVLTIPVQSGYLGQLRLWAWLGRMASLDDK